MLAKEAHTATIFETGYDPSVLQPRRQIDFNHCLPIEALDHSQDMPLGQELTGSLLCARNGHQIGKAQPAMIRFKHGL
jgi:hypothetical protein